MAVIHTTSFIAWNFSEHQFTVAADVSSIHARACVCMCPNALLQQISQLQRTQNEKAYTYNQSNARTSAVLPDMGRRGNREENHTSEP